MSQVQHSERRNAAKRGSRWISEILTSLLSIINTLYSWTLLVRQDDVFFFYIHKRPCWDEFIDLVNVKAWQRSSDNGIYLKERKKKLILAGTSLQTNSN